MSQHSTSGMADLPHTQLQHNFTLWFEQLLKTSTYNYTQLLLRLMSGLYLPTNPFLRWRHMWDRLHWNANHMMAGIGNLAMNHGKGLVFLIFTKFYLCYRWEKERTWSWTWCLWPLTPRSLIPNRLKINTKPSSQLNCMTLYNAKTWSNNVPVRNVIAQLLHT